MLAECYFRMFTTEVSIIRRFKLVLDWVAILGGLLKMMLTAVTLLAGRFLRFTQTYKLIHKIYEKENERVLDKSRRPKSLHPSLWKRL
jgi:hypothetical protein